MHSFPDRPHGRTRRRHLRRVSASRALVSALALLLGSCGIFREGDRMPAPPPPPEEVTPSPVPTPSPEPSATPTPGVPGTVVPASEAVTVTVRSEPARLPPAGGQAQIMVLVRKKRGGEPLSGVEVRLATTEGTLYSAGKALITDATGRTRDRLTTRRTAEVTVNAGGTIQRLLVPTAAPPAN